MGVQIEQAVSWPWKVYFSGFGNIYVRNGIFMPFLIFMKSGEYVYETSM